MAFLFVDSFSHYTQAFMDKKWDAVNTGGSGTTSAQSVSGVGRFGAGGITFAGLNGTGGLAAPPGDSQFIQKNYNGESTVIVGMALNLTSIQIQGTPFNNGARWLSFLDGNTLQVGIQILQSGQLRAIRNLVAGDGYYLDTLATPNYAVLGESTGVLSGAVFDYVEVKVVHHPSTGSVTVKRNTGETLWSLTNVNTAVSGSNNSSSVIVGGYAAQIGGTPNRAGLNAIASDFYLVGGSGASPTDFLGDIRVELLTPTADGNYTQWTPTGSLSHFANVDEIPPNESDYNSTATLNNKDSFIVSDSLAPSGAGVKAVVGTMYITKDDGGSYGVSLLSRLSGVDNNGTEFQVPSPYGFRQSFSLTKPGGGVWTVADVNSSEQGYERTT